MEELGFQKHPFKPSGVIATDLTGMKKILVKRIYIFNWS
jgi:hypothetical protein